jgi:hypothetical protein
VDAFTLIGLLDEGIGNMIGYDEEMPVVVSGDVHAYGR